MGADTNTTVRVLDLNSQLNLLGDGKLNLAVAGDVGIDWALLEFQVTPAWTYVTNSILPVADAYVWNGTAAGSNFGTATTLQVKTGSASVQRQAYLRWNLVGYPTNFTQARIRFTPLSVGTNGYENGAALVTNNAWDESLITWSNQPIGGKRFATWIPTTNSPIEFIVTPQVQAALAGDGLLSLELISLSNNGGSGVTSYASREDADPARRPQLLLVWLASPKFTNFVRGVDGSFTLSGTGPAGAAYRILATTNLIQPLTNWTAMTTGTFSGGAFSIANLQTTNFPQRYFRVVMP